ncbi:hypothetical protein GA0070609_3075 [Micromonospora echinaurantiaca]|uniref:Uncharacterized protein n=1 Tax=Micromonospora echinaurantiaca TaxID=47857 RepID=A0A1C5IC93_9ACTN|nr:hypothetical protein [Micromonospora echinaurantiaca]SCG55703.1 hypothetical protein GA0070609_3075 [Micromonospora echinaurantiaca]
MVEKPLPRHCLLGVLMSLPDSPRWRLGLPPQPPRQRSDQASEQPVPTELGRPEWQILGIEEHAETIAPAGAWRPCRLVMSR